MSDLEIIALAIWMSSLPSQGDHFTPVSTYTNEQCRALITWSIYQKML